MSDIYLKIGCDRRLALLPLLNAVMGSDACWCHGYEPETDEQRAERERREERWLLEDLGVW